MAYTYTSFVNALSSALTVDATDADFLALLSSVIDEAEQRIYRELDLVSCSVITPATMTIDDRFVTLPQTNGHIIVINNVSIIDNGIKYTLRPVTLDVIDYIWPNTMHTGTAKPQLFFRIDDTRIVVAPTPHSAWVVEIVGTIRPNPLGSNNNSTFLSTYLSDVFFAACMSAGNGILLKNYGAASEDPQQAMSWESKYQTLISSAKSEELRKLFISNNSPLPASAKA
jgi:hypothetical protein